jgi:GT2 family glycosyltransferase
LWFDATANVQSRLKSEAALVSETRIRGYVLDPSDPDTRFVVELLLDGTPVQLARANIFDPRLWDLGFGDGCYRFAFTLPADVLSSAFQAEVRLANTNQVVGTPLLFRELVTSDIVENDERLLSWAGGLRFVGSFGRNGPHHAHRIKVFVDAVPVTDAGATRWKHCGTQADPYAVAAFDFHLPTRFADGSVRQLRAIDEVGSEMPGSPCTFVAYEGGLQRILSGFAEIESEKLSGKLFDQLLPQSLPFSEFSAWRGLFPVPAATDGLRHKIAVVLIGDADLGASIQSLEGQAGCEWVAGALAEVEGRGTFRPGDLTHFLENEAAGCEAAVFALSGTILQPGALSHLANAVTEFPAASLVYSDVTVLGDEDREWPIAFPAFDYERMLEQGYGAYFFIARTAYANKAAARGASDLYRLFNMCVDGPVMALSLDKTSVSALPVHAPGFLARIPRPHLSDCSVRLARASEAHLKTRGISATSAPGFGALFPAARVVRRHQPRTVSVLIPTRDRVDLLKPCIASLQRTTNFDRLEVIVLDNDSSRTDTLEYFSEIADKVRLIHVRGPFNFPKVIAAGASVATGEMLLLLNNDVEAIKEGWMDEMLGCMADPGVGAVGATLLWPSELVQHSGVVMGPHFAARHAFNERMDGDPGYSDMLLVARQCSAVTAACLMTTRRLFADLAGFDGDRFPVNFNDVDFCLRLRARGYRIVVTPHAKLMHRESASRGRDIGHDGDCRTRFELKTLRAAWGHSLVNEPYYNPLLALDDAPFSALAWPPRPAAPRQPLQPAANAIPPGF